MKPVFNGQLSQQFIDVARANGLPEVNGKQALGSAKIGNVNWYHLEDGTEWIADDQGNETEWPQ